METSIRRLLLGLTGSSALLSVLPEFVQMRGALVQEYVVIMTPAAVRMIAPTLVSSALASDVYIDSMAIENTLPVHRAIPAACDAALVAPATLNTLSGLAVGATGNLLTLAIANFSGPVGVVPTLNREMAAKPAAKRVLDQLHADGYLIAEEHHGAATDLSGSAQRGVSKHAIRKLVVQLAQQRESGEGA
ncbi:phosphopantothenate--cysteine ligase family flavoprotein [Rathayibacter sp. AY2B3]|uniref:phosphopantothenate--cysteine ligase family flavoprotein n=1 Tax=Rathayibacter sp. AY2B3 TaxID=2080569 RepID=UPI0015E40B9A|nr:phosphopantothenate--cysteine ligase family flavoprotein [Rathayibacter sp. AY2B3]